MKNIIHILVALSFINLASCQVVRCNNGSIFSKISAAKSVSSISKTTISIGTATNIAIPIIKSIAHVVKNADNEKSKQVAILTFIADTLRKAKHIDLYYSLTGMDWTEVATKNLTYYQNNDTLFVTDKCPKKGLVYYKIRQSFSDVTFVYSTIVTAQVNGNEMALNIISPTVVDYLKLDIYSEKNTNCDLKISNVIGKILYAQKLKLASNNNSFSFNIEAFKKGNYYVEIVDPNSPKIISTSFYKN